jgi:hypothetical protein
LTTDSSILAVAEAKIVAHRTHDFCRAVQSAAARVERMTPSSQGAVFGLITTDGPRASSAHFYHVGGNVIPRSIDWRQQLLSHHTGWRRLQVERGGE